jgi:hypothetical protein
MNLAQLPFPITPDGWWRQHSQISRISPGQAIRVFTRQRRRRAAFQIDLQNSNGQLRSLALSGSSETAQSALAGTMLA